MNIFLHELKAYRKSTLIWTISLMGIVVFFLSLFPSISKDFTEFSKVLEGYPEGVRKALGLEIESFGSILGFYSYVFIYIALCGAIQAMILGTSIVSKETREKTADFLLTKPVTRTRIITSKLMAAIVSLVITNLFYFATAYIMAKQVASNGFSLNVFFLITFTLFMIQLIFLSIGIMISVVFSRLKAVLSVSLGTVFAFFIIGMVVSSDSSEIKRYLSPFKYFDTKYVIEHTKYEYSYCFVSLLIVIISIIVSYVIYTKKDVHAV